MDEPIVTISQGKLKGAMSSDIRGNRFHRFMGVPYAKPPIGDLRFKAPEPPEKWSGIYDATKEGSACYSKDPFTKTYVGSEYCLVLNVFTKSLPDGFKKSLKPVMVWIYGGAFLFGSSTTKVFGPEILMTEDIVLVTFNYRLGILGFLSFEDQSIHVPGNAGLKDMVMALRWVQKNIDKFNGDPNNVTIFGQSAGGTAVHFLTLTPLARGLFHKAIMQSSFAYNPCVVGRNVTKMIAKIIGWEVFTDRAILNYLRGLPLTKLFEIQEKIETDILPGMPRSFGFVIEKYPEELAFFTEHPLDMFLTGKMGDYPFLTGYNTCEGILMTTLYNVDQLVTRSWEDLMPDDIGYEFRSEENAKICEKIRQHYCGDEVMTKENLHITLFKAINDLLAYWFYVLASRHAAKLKNPTYIYRLSLETRLNFFKSISSLHCPGVAHTDDIGYLFKTFVTPKIVPDSIEDVSLKRIVRMWTNFARCGNPTPDSNDKLLNVVWKPVEKDCYNFLDIGQELVLGLDPDLDRIEFWREIYENGPRLNKILALN